MKTLHLHHRQQGLTIVELMVALLLGLILMAGILQLVTANKQTYRLHEGLARLQENGRFATEFLSLDVRSFGYKTRGITTHNNLDDTAAASHCPGTTYDGSGFIQGYNDVSSPLATELTTDYGLAITSDLASGNVGDVLAGTDIILSRGPQPCDGGTVVFVGLGDTYRYADTANIKIESAEECQLGKGDFTFICDNATCDIFAITNNPQSGNDNHDTLSHAADCNQSPKLIGKYGPGSEVYRYTETLLYIGKGAAGEPALFRGTRYLREDNIGAFDAREELVEGIENMQVTYGEDTDADGVANYFVDADSISDFDAVVALRISLLVRSQDKSTDANQSYTYNGTTATATDRRLRRVFTTTIGIRNRLS